MAKKEVVKYSKVASLSGMVGGWNGWIAVTFPNFASDKWVL